MFNSSPIETWDGAAVFMSFGANTGWTHLWFWVAVLCCLVPLWVALQAENAADKEHGS